MYEELKPVPEGEPGSQQAPELKRNERIRDVSHNSIFNCLFMITESNVLLIYDCNTNRCVRTVEWPREAPPNSHLSYVRLFNIQEKCLSISEKTMCTRMPYDGAYMLDTVFQTVCESEQARVTLELNVYNAEVLINALKSVDAELVNGLDEFVHTLEQQYAHIRAQKALTQWHTVRICDAHGTLMSLLVQSLDELKRVDVQSLGIPVLSGLIDRLFRLNSANLDSLPSLLASFDKRLMCSEANRRATFHEWPHMDYKWVLPDSLAQAGFFHQSATNGDDRTTCFVCSLCLVTWEPTDQPWSEHERHSPICHYVRGEVTENVPLSLTTATQAAHQVFKTENVS
jgi:baculoviral IAP repeat-containing protein 6